MENIENQQNLKDTSLTKIYNLINENSIYDSSLELNQEIE